MLLTATTAGPGGPPAVTTLLLAAVVVVSTAAVVDLLVQHRGELVRERGGAPGAARRARGRVRSLVAAALVDACALGLGTLLLTGATPTSHPLLVGLVGGVVGCAVAAAAVVTLAHVLRRHEPAASHQAPDARPAAPRTLAAVPPPWIEASPHRTAGEASATREPATNRDDRREERERGRGRQRREAVTAVETVLGRGAGVAPRRPADLPGAPSPGALAAPAAVPERQVPGGR